MTELCIAEGNDNFDVVYHGSDRYFSNSVHCNGVFCIAVDSVRRNQVVDCLVVQSHFYG